ncbi:MAG TPA: ribonuclease HI [Candidatus Atribacteria bacterium]|nr:ribonuclease HI [Candidatus Atribacteria bacterium]
MKRVDIYTDGACSGNPGPGGWAAILLYKGKEKILTGFEESTTNNRMELLGPINALEALKEPCTVNIYTDSAYVSNAFLQNWLDKWQKNNWLTSKKTPVENRDLWERLLQLSKLHDVTWIKVRGHSDNEINNRCDELAHKAIEEAKSTGAKEVDHKKE